MDEFKNQACSITKHIQSSHSAEMAVKSKVVCFHVIAIIIELLTNTLGTLGCVSAERKQVR